MRFSGTERIPALDSLRGIAAMAVVLGHAAITFELLDVMHGTLGELVRWTPFGLLFSGRPAVLLFFVLSGYALSCAVTGDRAFTYRRFLIRRTCRIWVPYAAVVLIAASVLWMIPPHVLPQGKASGLLLAHLAMTGRGSDLLLVPQAWSLVHEMRISIIFPLLLLFCRRGLPLALAAGLVVHAVSGAAIGCEAEPCTPSWAETVAGSFLLTAYLAVFFGFGIAIALKRSWLETRLRYAPAQIKVGLWIFSIAALTLGYRAGVAADLVCGTASAVLISLVVVTPSAQEVLTGGVFSWLGRISYSLYLTHWTMMSIMLLTFHDIAPKLLLFPVVVAESLLVAAVIHALIEAPALRLGKRLTDTRSATSHRRASHPEREPAAILDQPDSDYVASRH